MNYIAAAEELRENKEQWEAYESNGNCVILAGPGSGKTKTITIKLARLRAEEVHLPQQIACITYSNACVAELRTRLEKLGVEDGEGVRIATVHSFCLTEILIPFGRLTGLPLPDPIAIASSSVSNRLFKEACREALGNDPPRWFRTECDRTRRTIPDKDSQAWKDCSAINDKAAILAFEKKLAENRLLDFDGIVLAALHLVEEHAWIRNIIRARYPIIFIDEYQDLGLPLHRMVLALMTSGIRVIAVGDPDQSIYGFTGAKPALLRRLAKTEGVQEIALRLNYRCADEIISAAALLLKNAPDFQASESRQGAIRLYRLETSVDGQAAIALRQIVPRLLEANPTWMPGDIAFLYRSFNEGGAIARKADANNIKYFRADNGSPVPRTPLINWLSLAARWCASTLAKDEVSMRQVMHEWRLLSRSVCDEKEVFEVRADVVSTLFKLKDPNKPLRDWLSAVREAAVDRLLREEAWLSEEVEVLKELESACAKGGLLETYTVKIFGDQGRHPELINLMTLHGSKGLEFQAVIMVGMDEGEIPHRLARTQEEQEEATRLFYVGLTRAKTEVHLLYGFSPSPLVERIRATAAQSR